MSLPNDISENELLTTARTKKFSKLFRELERCREDKQKRKIEELNRLIDEMNEIEFRSIFTEELFNKIHQMIEEKKMRMEIAIILIKHVGYCKALKRFSLFSFDNSLLRERMREMMIDENEKKKEINEKILTDLCECYLLLNRWFSSEMDSICVPCLLKETGKKEENEVIQKEVEMVLLALSCTYKYDNVSKELYLNEIKTIIEYHQEHHNLTRLAYQSAWREVAGELEDLLKCMDWKRKVKGRKEITCWTPRKPREIISNIKGQSQRYKLWMPRFT
ncbi:uncharacterized protein MONOS_17235 [Monocercomonoides exilis]|uniref:uncharacterized protein n=1 Tax=Monocercomonoides exilis TaxID=2049356 RepID=UPI003559EA6D|nr:hypothetical protein MONOS_17235 [Monocercomonoides exilis]